MSEALCGPVFSFGHTLTGKESHQKLMRVPAEESSRVLLLVSGQSFPEAEIREDQSCAPGFREMWSKT